MDSSRLRLPIINFFICLRMIFALVHGFVMSLLKLFLHIKYVCEILGQITKHSLQRNLFYGRWGSSAKTHVPSVRPESAIIRRIVLLFQSPSVDTKSTQLAALRECQQQVRKLSVSINNEDEEDMKTEWNRLCAVMDVIALVIALIIQTGLTLLFCTAPR